jgi:2-dehydro-3-deoxyglucarate aldolase
MSNDRRFYKMNKLETIQHVRATLQSGNESIGGWMQIANSSVAEIMGQSGYDWVALDMEHGSMCVHQLPDIFRALELGGTLPLVRVARGDSMECKQALDAGAGGIIVPMIENADEVAKAKNACCWPPAGNRGVAFSRANLYGKHFDSYKDEAQQPLFVPMIENSHAVTNLDEILEVEGVDAIMIGPYDLSASMGMTAEFEHPDFIAAMSHILNTAQQHQVPAGIHVVAPSESELSQRIAEGYRFIAYSMDAILLQQAAKIPHIESISH